MTARRALRGAQRVAGLLTLCALALAAPAGASVETLNIPADAPDSAFPHVWEEMFGSGRAILSLRDSYRQDLRAVKSVTGFRLVRFHNIFHDEVGILSRDHGRLRYNFSYVDQIYDGLLDNGIRPFVEISFMPPLLSSNRASEVPFWYRPNRAPPRRYAQWDDLVRHFAAHLVERYGVEEVATWYFEVWNEPNIDFWDGRPKKSTYYTLYEHTAADLKAVNARLRVGGPATAQAAWVGDFLGHMHARGVPVDFVSSHVYANDTAADVLGIRTRVPRDQMVCRAVQKVHEEIARSATPEMPFFLSEFNASYLNEPAVTDSVFMGPWLANTIRQCAGMTALMSYWSFSDVFEEQGVVRTPFYGGYGLIAERGIVKPAYNAFALLHKLGARRIGLQSDSALATRRADGALAIALWNYAPPQTGAPGGARHGAPDAPLEDKVFRVYTPAAASGRLWRVDADHGNVLKTYDAMGRPPYPSVPQIEALKAAAQLPEPEIIASRDGAFDILVPPRGLALLELPR